MAESESRLGLKYSVCILYSLMCGEKWGTRPVRGDHVNHKMKNEKAGSPGDRNRTKARICSLPYVSRDWNVE